MSFQSRLLTDSSVQATGHLALQHRPVRAVFGWVRREHTIELRVLFADSDTPESIILSTARPFSEQP